MDAHLPARVVLLLCFGAPLSACPPEPAEEPACADGQLLDVEGLCVPEACEVGLWPEPDEDDGPAFRVAPWGSGNGDGSEADPFDEIADALDEIEEEGGGQILLSAGSWEERIELSSVHGDVVVAGRCAALTEVVGGDGVETVLLNGGRPVLRDLAVRGGEPGLVVASNAPSHVDARLRRVTVAEALEYGVLAVGTGAELDLRDCNIEDTLFGPEHFGDGLTAAFGPSVEVQGGQVRRSAGIGVHVLGDETTTLTAEGLAVLDNSVAGVFVQGDAARADLVDTRVAAPDPPEEGFAAGVSVSMNGTLYAERLSVEEVSDGLLVASASAELNDVVIADLLPGYRDMGWGLHAMDGASVVGSGVEILRPLGIGVAVEGADTTVELSDLGVRQVVDLADQTSGWAVTVEFGGELHVAGLLIEEARDVGLHVDGEGSRATIEGGVVRDTLPGRFESATSGRGVTVQTGAELVARDLRVEGSVEAGIALAEGAVADLEDCAVVGTGDPALFTGTVEHAGAGINVQYGSSLVARGLEIRDTRGVGLAVRGSDASVVLEDTQVSATSHLAPGSLSTGVAVWRGSLEATGLHIDDAMLYGLTAGSGAQVAVTDLRIERVAGGLLPGTDIGVLAQLDAWVELVDAEIAQSDGPGLVVTSGSTLDATRLTATGNGVASASALDGGILLLRDSELLDAWFTPGEGGGVGVYAWDAAQGDYPGHAPTVVLEDVSISGQVGQALYLRGRGTYEVRDSRLESTASWAEVPAVFARGEIDRWDGESDPAGLLLVDTELVGGAGDGVLLDGASATIEGLVLEDVGGEAVWWQSCDDAEPPLVDGEPLSGCQVWAREVAPLLHYLPNLSEIALEL
jgi:hypothetical protein